MSESIKQNPWTSWMGLLVLAGTIAKVIGEALGDGFQTPDITAIAAGIGTAIGLWKASDAPKQVSHYPDQR